MSNYNNRNNQQYHNSGSDYNKYTVATYSDNQPRSDERMLFLCRGTCGTEMGCTCGGRR